MRFVRVAIPMLFLIAVMTSWAVDAPAVPVVGSGGSGQVVTRWAEHDGRLELEIDPAYDAVDVAEAIREQLPGAKVSAVGSRVFIEGMGMDDAMPKLAEVQVKRPPDDIDALLGSLRPGATSGESGSSIRARKTLDFQEIAGRDEAPMIAEIVTVERARFPLALLAVRVIRPGSTRLKPGQRLTVLPRVKSRRGVVDPNDDASKLNVGAWYTHPGDRIELQLEPVAKNGVHLAAAFRRLPPRSPER